MPLPPIIFEDESLLVFDKPSGLLVAPDRWDKARENLMTLVHRERGQHIANVHRLDADTSGVLLCAKTKPALDFLSGQFQSKTADKRYHALVVVLPEEEAMKVIPPIRDPQGRLPDEFDVDLALGQDEANPGRMRVFKRRGGKPSLTHFRTLERFGRFAWVECEPKTGRTHQLRVQLGHIGHPIVGDPKYFDIENWQLPGGMQNRLHLLARRIVVPHPRGGTIDATAPLPPHMQQSWSLIGLDPTRYDPIEDAPES